MTLPADTERAIREAVSVRRDELIELVQELVRVPSLQGEEEPAQRIVADRLQAAGFEVERIEPDPEAALADPYAGYPDPSYAGRTSVAGRLPGKGAGRSMHLSGHIDVVPIDPAEEWTSEPFAAEVRDGRIWGRGAGDMKGGLAAYLIAATTLADVFDGWRGELLFSSVIEEETGGNGMWSVLRAGYDADATLIGEPTALRFSYAATGVVWARLRVPGASGHSMLGGREGPVDRLAVAIAALREYEAELNVPPIHPVFATASDWPFSMTVGKISGGVWTSSAPAEVVAQVRFGFGVDQEPAEVQQRIVNAIASAAPDIEVTFEKYRARSFAGDPTGELPAVLVDAHDRVVPFPTTPLVFTGTNDGRFVDGPCLCYGPEGGGFHGKDEWVDIESLQRTAATVALAAAAWIA